MNALASAIIGMTGYAFANALIAHKLLDISPLATIPIFTLIVCVGTLLIAKIWVISGHEVTAPSAGHMPWIILIGLTFIIADISFIGAYNMKGASVPMLTTTAALLPIMVSLIEKIFITGTMPSRRTCFAFLLGIFVVWLVAYDPANNIP